MTTKNLLVELFVEELPPKALRTLGEAFAGVLFEKLQAQGLTGNDAQLTAFASPRRLAAHVTDVRAQAFDKAVSQKLMPVAVGLEGDRQVLVRGEGGVLEFVPQADSEGRDIVVHDVGAADPTQAFALSRLDSPQMTHVPMGIFRSVSRPTYDDMVRAQVDAAIDTAGGRPTDADLDALIHGRDTWTVA